MKRKEFFSTFGISAISAGLLFMAPAVTSCSKDSTTDPVGGTNTGRAVDFTIDLTSPTYAALNTIGGSVIKDGIIIAKTSAGVHVAVAAACTHQGTTVGFESSANRFHCPNHGSNFGTDGSVINGPAGTALKKYNTTLTGTSLRVFA